MTDIPRHFHSAGELARAIRAGATDSRTLTRLFLNRIERGAGLKAFTYVNAERAMALAEAADRLHEAGITLGPWHGVPVAVKDCLAWEGTPLLGGSLSRQGHVSDRSSTVVRTLIANGMVVLGKTAMTEFAFGLSGQNPTCGTPHNPWDTRLARAPGGSSSGAGVAVAAGLVPLVIGGDSGGSVRAPALLNHLVGYKPSSGLISRAGCLPLSDTLDVLGPVARTVEDARVVTAILRGPDVEDPATLAPEALQPARYAMSRRLAVLADEAWPVPLHPEAAQHWETNLERLGHAGWTLQRWSPPDQLSFAGLARDNSTVLAYEAFKHYGAVALDPAQPLWSVVRGRIRAGGDISDADYASACRRRQDAMAAFSEATASVDALLMPGADQAAQILDPEDVRHAGLGAFLRPANFLGSAAISLPSGRDREGMPLGVQVLAPRGADALLLSVAQQLEIALAAGHPVPDLSSWGLE